MHWIDHSQLPPITGKIERFLLNSHGELDGLLLEDGTEVHFPPHLSEAVRRMLKVRSSVALRGLRPRAAPIVAAISLQAIPSGPAIVDQGPDDAARGKRPRQALEAAGKIVRVLHGPKGEARGALLDSGTIVRLGKHAGPKAAKLLVVGKPLAGRGEGVKMAEGCCIEAHIIGVSTRTLEPVKQESAQRNKPKHELEAARPPRAL
jgi:hypothetical protein